MVTSPRRAPSPLHSETAMHRRALLAVAALLLVCAARAGATSYTVGIYDNYYDPDALTISMGDQVYWYNSGDVVHTSTSNTNIWNSGFLSPGDSYSRTFNSVGTFPYHCAVHGLVMSGTITVTAVTPVQPSTWGRIKTLFR